MAKACAITTVDNPYSYFDNFNDWYMYDISHGYNTCALLSRIATTSDSLTEPENHLELEKAIDTIIRLDLAGIYKKVYE